MKNCLIVLVVLLGCFAVAVWLVLDPPGGGSGFMSINEAARQHGVMVATWRDYDDQGLKGLQVTIATNLIIVDVPAAPVYHRTTEPGHWNLHAFFCDSHVDSPPEVEVARELKNEDLDVDIGRFVPNHPGRITLVKELRGSMDEQPGYPVNMGQTVSYPPPKGLIRVGMLECDLQALPWQPEQINVTSEPVVVNMSKLSDGSVIPNYFPDYARGNGQESTEVYSYHSDRPDAPKLLVTVYHGRVTEVTGGAEETSDIPYQLPAPKPSADESSAPKEDRTWVGWLFDLIFEK